MQDNLIETYSLNIKNNVCNDITIMVFPGHCFSFKSNKHFLRFAKVIGLVYDITNKQSFDNIQDWFNKIREEYKYKQFIYLYPCRK